MSFDKPFEHSDALFETAVSEFCTQGYQQASINTILQKAGMSKGQFYYHFGNKEGLYLALIEVLIARKVAFMQSIMQPGDFQQDIFGILKTQTMYGMAFAREYPAIDQFANSFLQEKGTPIYDKAMAIHNFEDNRMLNVMIAQAYANGDFRVDLPLEFVQKTIGYLFTHVTDLTGLSSTVDAEENLNYLIAFMKTGLARNPESD
ncbi:MAG: TetR/AcrR family transcriptional regulator [Chloroflexota bacterium]